MASVSFKNVTKKFDKVVAVDSIEFTISEGEFFTLLGPSGCGKTTTLRMVAGFYYPTEGDIYFGDKKVTHLLPEKRNTGMVFQNYALFPHMTAYENIAYGLQVRKNKKDEIKRKVEEVLKLVEMEGYGPRKISQLSGGQQQRIAVARALVIRPDILLLDEPLSNLDAKLRKRTSEELRKIQQKLGITAIYVTHDQEEAFSVSDKIAIMEKGKVHQIDTPDKIFNYPRDKFVAEFLGKINILSGKVKGMDSRNITLSTGGFGKDLAASRRRQNEDLQFEREEEVNLGIHTNDLNIHDKKINERCFKGNVVFKLFSGLTWDVDVRIEDKIFRVTKFNNISNNLSNIKMNEEVWLEIPSEAIYLMKKRVDDNEIA